MTHQFSNKKLKIKYVDFFDGFNPKNNFLGKLLANNFNTIIDNKNPDLIICGGFDNTHLDYDLPKIMFSGENGYANPNFFDLIICPNDFFNNAKVFQHSVIFEYEDSNKILKNRKRHSYANIKKTKFCAFLYANDIGLARKVFCTKLMDYKKVDCLGSVMRNTELIVARENLNKLKYTQKQIDMYNDYKYIYKDYKFNIAFENSSSLGYVCEKILKPLLVGSIPIYWGADDVKEYFNPDCFINVNDFDSFDACIEYVKKVDNDDELYQKYLNTPPILPSSKLYSMTEQKVIEWLKLKLPDLLNNKVKKIGKIGTIGRIRYYLWYKISSKIRKRKIQYLYNVKMPLAEKIKWIKKKI